MHLSFSPTDRERRDPESQRPRHFLDIMIDGVSLRSLLNMDGADFVTGLSPDWPEGARSHANELVGARAPEMFPDRIAVYVCPECGDAGCGAVTMRLRLAPSSVVWDEFARQDPWDLFVPIAAGPFEFDRPQYESAIREAAENVAAFKAPDERYVR